MTTARPFLPWYIAHYWRDRRHLTLEQHGAYLLLLGCLWNSPTGRIPNNSAKIARMLGITVKKWHAIRDDILALMTDEGDCLSRKRLDREIAKAAAVSKARAASGRKATQKIANESEKIAANLFPHAGHFENDKLLKNHDAPEAIADTHARASFNTSQEGGGAPPAASAAARPLDISDSSPALPPREGNSKMEAARDADRHPDEQTSTTKLEAVIRPKKEGLGNSSSGAASTEAPRLAPFERYRVEVERRQRVRDEAERVRSAGHLSEREIFERTNARFDPMTRTGGREKSINGGTAFVTALRVVKGDHE